MKKILIFSYHLNGTGGTESVLNEWFSHLNPEAGYDVELLIYGGYPDLSFIKTNKVSVLEKRDNVFNKIKSLFKLRYILNKGNYDYVLCLGLNTLRAVQLALKSIPNTKTKVFYWTHFRVESSQFNKKTEMLLNNCDGILALCDEMKNQFCKFSIDSNKVHTIYNPIKRASLKPKSKNGNKFYYIGRLDENQKRISDVIKAFHLLINKENIDCSLTIIGIGDSYDYYKYLIEKYDLEDKVELCDLWFKDPWEYIDEIDCLILSSNFEGFGMVIAEAISRGVPVISSNCSVGPSDIITHNYNGFLYEVGDLLALRDTIKNFLKSGLSTSQEDIVNSIDKMYVHNYFDRVKKIFK